ncbi:MAG: acyl-CoA dehydrogenase family protein [Sphingomonadaceae bacterium]
MDLTFTDDQEQLRAAVRGYLERNNDFVSRRTGIESATGFRSDLWSGLAIDLGLLGICVPETSGGTAGSHVDLMVVMEELGRNLAVEPFLETAVIAPAFLTAGKEQGASLFDLSDIVSGKAIYAFAWDEPDQRYAPASPALQASLQGDSWHISGTKSVVTGAPWATHILFTAMTDGKPAVFVADMKRDKVSLTPYPMLDGKMAADITFDNTPLPQNSCIISGGGAESLIEKVMDLATAMIGAESLGIMRRMLEDTIEYTKQRHQFGQAISGFQVLQHRMVDMFMHLEMAVSAVYRAVLSLDESDADRASAVSAMKVTVGDACRFIGQNAVQLHGGMGMSDELAVGHYFKRATVIENDFGSTDYHLRRFVRLSQSA